MGLAHYNSNCVQCVCVLHYYCQQATCHDSTNCTVAVWSRRLSHGALYSAGYYHGWKADNEHFSGDAFSVSNTFGILGVV